MFLRSLTSEAMSTGGFFARRLHAVPHYKNTKKFDTRT